MKIKMITGQFCGRCHTLKPHLEKFCEENNYELEIKDINETSPEEIGSATMLPIIRWGDNQIDYDEVLNRISA